MLRQIQHVEAFGARLHAVAGAKIGGVALARDQVTNGQDDAPTVAGIGVGDGEADVGGAADDQHDR